MAKKTFFSGLEHLVLLTIARLGSNAYGVSVRDELCAKTDKKVSYGAVYKALNGLKGKGFVSTFKGKATFERGGRAKIYYRTNACGRQVLEEYDRSIEQLKLI